MLVPINYTNKYFLIKKIPFFQVFPFTESIHFKSLYTPQIKYHIELGYSVNFTHHVNFGLFCSINDHNNFEKISNFLFPHEKILKPPSNLLPFFWRSQFFVHPYL